MTGHKYWIYINEQMNERERESFDWRHVSAYDWDYTIIKDLGLFISQDL